MDVLVGLTIRQALQRLRDGAIFLETTGGWLLLLPEGDCCASCHIQHVAGADALRGGTVASVETIESVPMDDELAAADVLDAWGHRITTNRGVCTIEMRTDHNGYYSGSLSVFRLDYGPFESVPSKPLDDF